MPVPSNIEFLTSATLIEAMTTAQAEEAQLLRGQEIVPTLAILEGIGRTALTGEINTYVRGKLAYMADIGVATAHFSLPITDMPNMIARLNADPSVHGIIVEEPLPFEYIGDDQIARNVRRELTAIILDQLHPAKAIDSQGRRTLHPIGATAEATVALLDHHGHTGDGQHVLVVGRKGTVGGGVHDIYASRSAVTDLSSVDFDNSHELPKLAQAADLIVVATGSPGTLTPELVREGHVIAGVGAKDIHEDVYNIDDRKLHVTPRKGGIGPVTIRVTGGRVLAQARQLIAA